ncbi:MAG: Ferric reductase like transrane component, partial [Thermoleophilia bacterium]|nr:Ferric reductase like transrane component [Thermoleophilia bacterium]
WRALHFMTFPTWLLAAGHGVLAGTDSAQPWMRALYLGSIGIVAGLVLVRAGSVPARRPPPKPTPAVPPTTPITTGGTP